jgi:G3E family GTPase
MIVEPTGVATISQILQILQGEDLRKLYSELSLVHILDVSEFLSFFKSHRRFIENQISRSNVVVLNKVDRVKQSLVGLFKESIREINPLAEVYPTSFARLDPTITNKILKIGERSENENNYQWAENQYHHVNPKDYDEELGLAAEFRTYGRTFDQVFNISCLELFFEELRQQTYGAVIRAKGVFRTTSTWLKLELASGEVHMENGPKANESVISVIGRDMNVGMIDAKLSECFEK